MKSLMSFIQKRSVALGMLCVLFIAVISIAVPSQKIHSAVSSALCDVASTYHQVPVTADTDNSQSPSDNLPLKAGASISAALIFPWSKKRPVQFRRGSGRPYTPATVADASVAYDNSGGAKLTQRRFQNGLKLKTRRVRLSLTATANASPVIFDFIGVSTRTVANVTIGGTKTTNTETMLRNLMGTRPFTIGKVWIQVSVSTMWNSINLQFINATLDGQVNQIPFDAFFIQNPMNTNTLVNITDPINVLADGGFALAATLLNGEVLTLGFEVPEMVDTYAMNS